MIKVNIANKLLEEECPTITKYPALMSKGSIHDYYSNGSYWWPNPKTANNLPYIRKDGQLNPNNFTKHKDLLLKLSIDSSVLYRAYHLTKERKYIEKLEKNLHTFFVNPNTKMNPSLNYSQAIPGICEGRSIGLIDTLQLIDIPVITLEMERNELFSKETIKGLKSWFSEYSNWLINSDFGKTESKEKNNHSITYFAELSSFSLLSSNREEIQNMIIDAFKNQLIYQMKDGGFFPLELKRTRPFGYSIFVVDNLATIALLASKKNDLWDYSNVLKKAIYTLLPYIKDKNSWPFGTDIEMWNDLPCKSTFLYFASYVYKDEDLLATYNKLESPNPLCPAAVRNIPIKTPEAYLPFLNT